MPVCIAAGGVGVGIFNNSPLVAQSTDGGITWSYPTLPDTIDSGIFYSGSVVD
jgi:hypothetical protein